LLFQLCFTCFCRYSLLIYQQPLGKQNGYKLAAEIYREDKGVKADGYKAIELYAQLDNLDDKEAAMNIAKLYENGCGRLKANGYKALEIYDDVIRQGKYWAKIHRDFGIKSPKFEIYKEALNNAAQICLNNNAGVRPDGLKAIEYLSALAENNDMYAIREIATIYLYGKAGVEPNGEKAIEYLAKLAENDDMEAVKEIAEIYRDGQAGIEPDGEKAIEYFIQIIQRDEPNDPFASPSDALNAIAQIYRYGKGGVAQDGHKAIEYYSKLVENKDFSRFVSCKPDDAFLEMGRIFEEGCGAVAPDTKKALDFYQKSADLGNRFARTGIKLLELLDER